MDEESKDKAATAAGIGLVGCYAVVAFGIPVLLFITLALGLVKSCIRMLD